MYQLGEVIGRGATGVVHRTVDPTTGRHLAVKVLHPHLVGDAKAQSRFILERHVLSRVSHPNVVQVIELVAEGDQLSIVMELVEGGDLKQLHQRAQPRPSEAATMVAGIADALAALHAGGVVHRDLKPANVLIVETADGPVPKITDFGLSRLVEEGMSQSSAAVGTPLYMAPEAVERASTAGPPADVYSLGIMLYELLIGAPPFVGGGTMAILRAHSEELPPMIEGVPAELQAIVRQMLAKEPSARPTAAEVRDRLRDVAARIDDTSTPRAVPDTMSESDTVTRVRPLAGVGAGAGLGGAGLGASGGGSGSGGPRALTFDDPDMTVAAGSPAASLGPSLLVALPERRIGPWPAERVLIAGATALAALVLVGVLVAVKVAGGDKVDPDAVSFAFDPELVGVGGIATRHWSLSSDGALLSGELKVFNGGEDPLSLDYVEVLPESLGVGVDKVRFEPAAAELLPEDRAGVLKVDDLDPQGTTLFTYAIDVEPGESTQERLAAWAQDQMAAQKAFYAKQENADREEPRSLEIATLTITPDPLNLVVGVDQDLVLVGELADGTAAPPEALAAAAWSTSDPVVADMVGNRVIPRAAGTGTISAQVGDTVASVSMLVEKPAAEVIASPERDLNDTRGTVNPTVTPPTPPPPTPTPTPTPPTPTTDVPAAPGTISVGEAGLNGVDLSWPAPADNGAAIDQYEVRIAGGASKSVSGISTSWTGLAYATTYRFEARAHNSVGWGPWGGTSGGYLTAEKPGAPTLSRPVATKVSATSESISFTSSTCTTADYNFVGTGIGHTSPGWPRAWQKDVNCWYNHAFTFTGLTPGTTYTVAVDLHDTGGGSYKTQTIEFTMGGPVTTTLSFTKITDTSLTVSATTSQCAVMTISLSGGSSPKSTGTTCDTSFTATFTGLTPATLYMATLSGTASGTPFLERNAKETTLASPANPDINRDGVVNCADVDILTKVDWGTSASRSDLNRDGTVSIFDLSILLSSVPAGTPSCS